MEKRKDLAQLDREIDAIIVSASHRMGLAAFSAGCCNDDDMGRNTETLLFRTDRPFFVPFGR